MIYWKQLNSLPLLENRNPSLFYYELQDLPGGSYLITRNVKYNHIGCICTTADVLGEKESITNAEFEKLGIQENNELHETVSYILKYSPQNSYPEIVKCDDIVSDCQRICGNYEIVYAVGLRNLGSVFVTNSDYSNKNLAPNVVGTILYDCDYTISNYMIKGDICVVKYNQNSYENGLAGYTLEEALHVRSEILNIYGESKGMF